MYSIWFIDFPGYIKIAVIDTQADSLYDFAVWYPGKSDLLGNIYLGRILKKMTSLGGAFVNIGEEMAGFLPDNAGAKSLNEGDYIGVKVTRSAHEQKGVRLDGRNLDDYQDKIQTLKIKSPQLLQKGSSPFEELANRYKSAPIFIENISLINLIPAFLKPRIVQKSKDISDHILEEIETLTTNNVDLPLGMKATIYPTPALTAIDIDSAAYNNDKENKFYAQQKGNRAILPTLLRHIILRNLSGSILIDLAGIPSKKRKFFYNDFDKILSNDPLNPKFVGFSHLGFAEITRPRFRPSLYEITTSNHAKAVEILSQIEISILHKNQNVSLKEINLILNTELYNVLSKDQWALSNFEHRITTKLNLFSNPSFKFEQWDVNYG